MNAGLAQVPDPAPLVLISVGTDHHPFDRLVTWVDDWLATRPEGSVRCIVQSGTSRAPVVAEHRALYPHDDLQRLLADARVVVSHGGPSTIAEALRAGRRPIVVPRRHDLGEHVDDHQVRFSRRLADEGRVDVAEDEATFRALLEQGLASDRSAAGSGDPPEGIDAFARLIGDTEATPEAGGPRVRVLYVGGWGRSGSTLVDRMLGQVPGLVSVGEMREGWIRGCIEDRRCGCGEPFSRCPFWQEVGAAAFGGWDAADPELMATLRRRFDRPWTVPLLAAARRIPRPRGLRRYVAALGALYRAIADVSGSEVIVDSSKIPSYALLLRLSPLIDVRVVHLVRDPRGVVHSWRKHVVRADATTGRDTMTRYGVLPAALRYDLYNAQAELLRPAGLPYLRVRYEDIVDDPARWMGEMTRHAGSEVASASLGFLDGRELTLEPAHTVDGNPMRFATGALEIRRDDAWRQDLPRADRELTTRVTAPLMRRYGYGT